MNLPFFKKSNQSTGPREYLFALEIGHSLIKSAIWTVANGKPHVVSQGSVASWNDSEESLLAACDQTLSDASSRLDQSGKIQPEKVILGVPSDWMTDDKIRPEHQRELKNLFKKLSLTAVGFVVTPDAMVRFLEKQEGVPPTSILIGFWPHHIDITLVRLGKIDGTQLVSRSKKVTDDVIEGLSRFHNVDMFPSRILLYDSGLDLEEIKQTLLAHPWQAPQTRLPFLHFPKIEVLPTDYSVRAIALAGGSEVAQAIGLITPDPEPAAPPPEPSPDAVPFSDASELGFVSETDIRASELPPAPPAETYIPFPTTPVAASAVSRPRRKLNFRLPILNIPRFRPRLALILVLAAGLLSLIGLSLAYWYFPKSQVTIFVSPKSLSHEFNLVADTQISTPDTAKPAVPARLLEVTSETEKTIPATGSKIVGDKATGTVTVINGTSNTKSFPAGTVITSPSGLKFTLDSEVQIASASGTADPNSYQPGKKDVKVTAADIGADGNLSAGTQFRIGSFSTLDFVARNETAFSGGSSRQVKAVARGDITSLRTELADALRIQARTELEGQVGADELIISESVIQNTVSENFSHQADDVADDLTLKLKVKSQGMAVSRTDISQIVTEAITPQIPDGYNHNSQINPEFSVLKAEKTQSTLSVRAAVNLVPSLNHGQIIAEIRGKRPEVATSYLENLPGVTRVDYTFSFHLPPPLLTLPHVSRNITLEIQAAE